MKKIIKEWFTNAPWGKIAMISWGNPKGESVLLVHGRQDSAATFIPILEYLPDKYHYVALDLPGHGKSDPFPIGVMLSRFLFVSSIDFVVQHLGWNNFIYIGHSMGCDQGLFFNAIYPEKISKFIFFDPIPSLQRLQHHNPVEYYNMFYENYYSNYRENNLNDRTISKRKAIESVMRARGLNESQAELVLSRNLVQLGEDKYRFSKLALDNEKELILKVPWGNLTALCWGDSSHPPVLLCPGRLDACSSFRPLVRRLPPARFYVSVDLPGNGRSDHYPRGGSLNIVDYVPPIEIIRDHFEWKNYTFVGHSMGAAIGKYLNHLCPGQITRMVDIDPGPLYAFPFKDLPRWYKYYCSSIFCGNDNSCKLHAGSNTAPKYTYDEIREKLMTTRGLSGDQVDNVLERCLESAGDGRYRLTFDQRLKFIYLSPFLYDSLHEFITAPKTPTLGIFASESVKKDSSYKDAPFALDDTAWRHGNYRHIVVDGGHDLHLQRPEEMARLITKFMEDNTE